MRNDKITNEDIHNPHDKLFKAAFMVKETVTEFIINFFPKELLELIDLKKLKLDTNNYIAEDLKEYFADVVYSTKLNGRNSTLVLLFEHKTTISKALFLQLLGYMYFIWKKDFQEKRPFSIIIPIVVYQNKRKYFRKSWYHLFPNLPEELKPYIPNFDFILTQVKNIGDVTIFDLKDEGLLKTVLLAFKHIENTDFVIKHFDDFFKFFQNNPHLEVFSRQLLIYLYRRSGINLDIIRELVNQLPQSLKSEAMTTYAQIKEEGKIEGKIEGEAIGVGKGIEKKNIQVIESGYLNGVPIELLSKITETSIEYVKFIIQKMNNDDYPT